MSNSGNAFTVNMVDLRDGNLSASINRTILPCMSNCLTKHRHNPSVYKHVSGFIQQIQFAIDVLYENRGINNKEVKLAPVIVNGDPVNGSFTDRCATDRNPIVVEEINKDDFTMTVLFHRSVLSALSNALMNCSNELSRSNAPSAVRSLGYQIQNASDVLFGLVTVDAVTSFPIYDGDTCVANEDLIEEVSVA